MAGNAGVLAAVGHGEVYFKVLSRPWYCSVRPYPFGEFSELQRSSQKEQRTVSKHPLSGIFEEHFSALPSPISCPPSPVLYLCEVAFCACLVGHTLSVFPVIFSHLFFPTLERPDLSSQYQLSSCWKCLGEAAGVRHVQAVTHISSQLSKASETSDCAEDLQVSNRSDRELIQPMVSH